MNLMDQSYECQSRSFISASDATLQVKSEGMEGDQGNCIQLVSPSSTSPFDKTFSTTIVNSEYTMSSKSESYIDIFDKKDEGTYAAKIMDNGKIGAFGPMLSPLFNRVVEAAPVIHIFGYIVDNDEAKESCTKTKGTSGSISCSSYASQHGDEKISASAASPPPSTKRGVILDLSSSSGEPS
eukprot:Tbor_TRINITY_DN2068_c1_g1::TRINITY_DN2068_c1_g1_i1::g.12058::m.12058